MSKNVVVAIVAVLLIVGGLKLSLMDYQPSAVPDEKDEKNAQPAIKKFSVDYDAIPHVLATVNGEKLTSDGLKQYLHNTESRLASLNRPFPKKQYDRLVSQFLESAINFTIFSQEAKANHLEGDIKAVQKDIERLKGQFSNGEGYMAFLHKEGITEGQLIERMRKTHAVRQLLKKNVNSQVNITDELLKKFYNENSKKFEHPELVRARHILLPLKPDAPEAKVKETEKLMAEIVKKYKEEGVSFELLAKQYSKDGSAQKGGDLGLFPRGAMVKEFEDVAFSLTPGGDGRVVRTRFGLHYVQTTEKQPAGLWSFDKIKSQLKTQMVRSEINKRSIEFLGSLKKKTVIKKFL